MKVGLNLPVMVPGLDRDLVLEWSRRVDAGPFSSLAAGERINFPNPELLVTLSAAAAVTERVALSFYVMVLPLHREALVAKQVATLDVLSGGRVSLGVGVGGRYEDYAALDVPFRRRFDRLEQQVGRLREIWGGQRACDEALRPVEPAPLRPGGPEILSGSLGPKSIERAARWADGLAGFSFGPSAEEIGRGFDRARAAWQRHGREAPPRLVTGFWFALGAGARERMDAYLVRYLNFLGPGAAEKLAPSVTATSEARLRQALRAVADLGADEVILVPTTADPDEIDRVADVVAAAGVG